MKQTELIQALIAPFPASAISWKPQAITQDKKRALAVAYIDARDVAERLDEVLGPLNWQVDHKQAGDQIVTGLAIRCEATGEFVWKWDAGFVSGADSDSKDEQMKARKGTISDGLKRAAVLWGIGRYLYRLPKVWVDYDQQHRVLATTPALPEWALPESERKPVTEKTRQAVSQHLADPLAGNQGSNGQKPVDADGPTTVAEAQLIISPIAPKERPEFSSKTLGELLAIAPKFVDWIATTMPTNDDPLRQTAKRAASILIADLPAQS